MEDKIVKVKSDLSRVIQKIGEVKSSIPIDAHHSAKAFVDEIVHQMDVAIQLGNDAIGRLEKEASYIEIERLRNESMGLPAETMTFNATLAGHTMEPVNGIHGTSIVGILVGSHDLFDDESNNHGIECTVIIIPRRRLHTAGNHYGDRVKFGNVLERMAEMSNNESWIEKGGKNG